MFTDTFVLDVPEMEIFAFALTERRDNVPLITIVISAFAFTAVMPDALAPSAMTMHTFPNADCQTKIKTKQPYIFT